MTPVRIFPAVAAEQGNLAAVLRYLEDDVRFVLTQIDPGTKGPKRKGWNTPAKWIDSPARARRHWSRRPSDGVGLIHGPSGTCALDVDDLPRARAAFATLGLDLDSSLAQGCGIVGRPDRAKAIYAVDREIAQRLRRHVYDADGLTVFELRGGPVQDVLPPTIHPGTGRPYAATRTELPAVPPELLALFLDWPGTIERLRPAATSKAVPARPSAASSDTSVIDAFNAAVTCAEILSQHGYEQKGDRWLAPTSKTGIPGVALLENGHVFSHHGADPLADEHSHDAFDLFRILEHGGDTRQAVRAAAEQLGFANHPVRTTPAAERPAAPETPAHSDWHHAGDVAREATGGDEPPPSARSGVERPEQLSPLVICAAELATRPELLVAPDAVIPGLAWKGRVTLFASREKTGKSTTLAAGVAALSLGKPFLSEGAALGRTLYWSADRESLADQLARLLRFGADLGKVDLVQRPPVNLEEVTLHLDGHDVFVVDTLASASPDITDAFSSSQWGPLLLRYVDLARRTGCAVVLVHHASKNTGKYRDSTSIGATVDVIVEMAPGADPDTRELSTVARWPAPAKRCFRLAGTTDASWLEVIGALRPQLDARLLAAIEEGPHLPATAYVTKLGARKGDVLDGVARLAHDGAIRNIGTEKHPKWERASGSTVPTVPNGSGNPSSVGAGNGSQPYRGEPYRTAAAPDGPATAQRNRPEADGPPSGACPACGRIEWTWIGGGWQCEGCVLASEGSVA